MPAHATPPSAGRSPSPALKHPAALAALTALVALAALLLPLVAAAAPITLLPNTVNMFRDTRGANNVGIGQGDLFQYGADISGGSAGARLSAGYGPTGFQDTAVNCSPLAVNSNFCSNSTAYSANRSAQPWTLKFERGSDAPLTTAGPSLAGTEVAVPFPVNVTITGAGLTPTISWNIPGNFTADAVRINIYDRSRTTASGFNDVIHSFSIAANAGSYTIPSQLNSGLNLKFGGDYVFNIQLIDTRGNPATFVASNNNAEILRRSSSFFSFTPLNSSGPPQAVLPTVVNGVYNFAVTNVGPNSVTFIDPFVAVGYDYATGAGDPNFASVIAPTGIGDGRYDLFLWNGSAFVDSGIDLVGGTQYFFGGAGVSRFSIRGIETSAALDPANVAAFITGLTFTSNGSFTGTMTPLVVEVNDVPEPPVAALLLLAALVLRAFSHAAASRPPSAASVSPWPPRAARPQTARAEG